VASRFKIASRPEKFAGSEEINIQGSDPDTATGVQVRMTPGEWKVANPNVDYYPTNAEGERQLFHATPSKLDHLWGSRRLPSRLLQQVLAVSRSEALKHGTGELTYATSTTPYSSRVVMNALTRGDVIENPNNPKSTLARIVADSHNPTETRQQGMESSLDTGDVTGRGVHSSIDSGYYDDSMLSSEDISDAMGSAYRARINTKQRMKPSESELGAAQDNAMAEYTRQQQATAGDTDLFGEPLNPRSLAQSKADIHQPKADLPQSFTPSGTGTTSTTSASGGSIDWREEGISQLERLNRMAAHLDQLTQTLADIDARRSGRNQ